MAFTVTSVNVNGIRAAHRKGMMEWLDANPCDVLLLQEVRADEEIATELLGDSWESIILPCRIKGRAGANKRPRDRCGRRFQHRSHPLRY